MPTKPAPKKRKPAVKQPLKTFLVSVREVHVQQVRIEAKSQSDAIVKVAGGKGEFIDNSLEFSHACDADTWTVEEEN